MTADERCDEIRELAAELALGIADGEDRARVLEHLADCADCRREVEGLSAVADTFDGTLFTWHVASPTGFSGGSSSPDDGFDY